MLELFSVDTAGGQGAAPEDESGSQDRQRDFLGFDDEFRKDLRKVWERAEGGLPSVLDEFYAKMAGEPELAAILGTGPATAMLKKAQTAHWDRLFAGDFGAGFIADTTRIGRAHARIGLEPTWYMTGYAFVLSRLLLRQMDQDGMGSPKQRRRLAAMVRAVIFDMALGVQSYVEAEKESSRQRVKLLAASFNASFNESVTRMRAATDRMAETATSIAGLAEQSRSRSNMAENAAQQAAACVQTMAAATAQLACSIGEISRRTVRSADTVNATMARAVQAGNVVATLRERACAISGVVKQIKGIAGQTQMLSLNAAIESARAGEMGRGFSVVAGEVRALSGQVTLASGEIGGEVEAIAAVTDRIIETVDVIAGDLGSIGEMAAGIACAVEEQTAATGEISRAAEVAANAGETVARSTSELLAAAAACDAAAAQLLEIVEALAVMAGEVEVRSEDFLVTLLQG